MTVKNELIALSGFFHRKGIARIVGVTTKAIEAHLSLYTLNMRPQTEARIKELHATSKTWGRHD